MKTNPDVKNPNIFFIIFLRNNAEVKCRPYAILILPITFPNENLQVIGNKVYRAEGRDIKNQKKLQFFFQKGEKSRFTIQLQKRKKKKKVKVDQIFYLQFLLLLLWARRKWSLLRRKKLHLPFIPFLSKKRNLYNEKVELNYHF
jgi:hypothetical protein